MRSVTFFGTAVAFFVVAVAFFGAAAAVAEPCAPPSIFVRRPVVFPADGDFVPTNATFLVADPVAAVTLVTTDDDVPFSVRTLDADDGFGASVTYRHIVPGPVPAGATLQLRLDGQAAVTVVVEDRVDDEPPSAPRLAIGETLPNGSCVPYVTLVDEGAGDDVVALIAAADDPGLDDDVPLDGLGSRPVPRNSCPASEAACRQVSVSVAGAGDEARAVRVAAVDVAGNVSDASSIDVVFPPDLDRAGCGGCGGGTVAPGLLLLPLLRRRRRR